MAKTRVGEYKNHYSGESAYNSFLPSPLPPNPPVQLGTELIHYLIQANNALTALNVTSDNIANLDLFVSMYIRKEALLSSQIEGTQATIEDIFNPGAEENANQDVEEVINYIKATRFALKRLEELPLCNRLLREIHAILMDSTRGQHQSPGEYRTIQNWIGGPGSSLRSARYVPPAPDEVVSLMSDLEKYIHAETKDDPLIQAALIHYQFESIHPFLDGNGRVGRLLILLFLLQRNILSTPALYVSVYLKQNRTEYYDRLSLVRNNGDYEQWILFFLKAVTESAQDAIGAINKLNELHKETETRVLAMGRVRENGLRLLQYMEQYPILTIDKTAIDLGLAYNTVAALVKRFCDSEILQQSSGNKRNRIFSYEPYLAILRKGTEL